MTFGNKRHLVIFHCISSGLNGSDLGSDENEIVFLVYLVVDLETKKVTEIHKYPVRPNVLPPSSGPLSSLSSSTSSLLTTSTNNNDISSSALGLNNKASTGTNGINNINSSNQSLSSSSGIGASTTNSTSAGVSSTDENESVNNSPSTGPTTPYVTFDQIRNSYQLTEDVLKNASSLEAVIDRFETDVARKSLNSSFTLVTDGQLHIRQCLFPEAQRKNIRLPTYYYQFHDLRKEYMAAKPNTSVASLRDMLNNIDNIDSEETFEPATKDVQLMAKIVLKLICDDVKFHEPDIVQTKLEQGIRSQTDKVDTHCCVRARGLPWQASDQDIARFFVGLNVAKGGVALCLSSQGRRNGEALVLFENSAHRDMALSRHKHHIGNRYIEVYKATGEDFINVAGGNNKDAQQFLSRGGQVIIRMRGLPYDATPKQVMDFFAKGDSSCKVLDETDGVLFVRKPDGRATGDAFVLFDEEEDADKALQKHKDIIGSRYIELFRSTTAEVQQVLNRTMEQHGGTNRSQHHNHRTPLLHHINNANHINSSPAAAHQLPLISQIPSSVAPQPSAVLPQQMITAGTRKDCIRLRGLPYTAQVEHILEFLGEHAKSIMYQGVHMVYNSQGQPSGEAFIQMTNEQSAFLAAQNRHHRYMGFGKKQRYIEVFQCSGEDMNSVLIGPQPSTLAMAAQALAGGANPGATVAGINTGGGILPGSSPSAIAAAAAAKSSTPSAGLLPPGMLNSLQNHPSAILSSGLVGNQMATFSNSQPPPPPAPPATTVSSTLDQYNALNNSLLLNQQNLALFGQTASAANSQLGIANFPLPPPSQSSAAAAAIAVAQAAQNSAIKGDQSNPSAQSLTAAQAPGAIQGYLQNVRPSNNLALAAAGDPTAAAMWNAAIAAGSPNGIPASAAQSLFPFGVTGLATNPLSVGAQSLLPQGSSAQLTNAANLQLQQAALGGLGGFLLPPPSATNSPLLRLPSPSNANPATAAAALAFTNQQNQASLLQSQLAAQRLLLSQSVSGGLPPNSIGIGNFSANPGLLPTVSLGQAVSGMGVTPVSSPVVITTSVSSNPGKRSFDQAFNNSSSGVAAAVAHAAAANAAAKRASYSYDRVAAQPTISAGPTTYPQASSNDA